jgi:hypothetical protein
MYVQKCILASYKVPLYLSDFIETSIFSTGFRKYPSINFMKIRSVGAELFHADGQTGGDIHTTETTGAFRNFVNAP